MKILFISFVFILQFLSADSGAWNSTKEYTLKTIEQTKDITIKAYDTTIEYTHNIYENSKDFTLEGLEKGKEYGMKGVEFGINAYNNATEGMDKEALMNTAVVTALAVATVSSGGATAPAILSVASSVPVLSKMINDNNLSKILIKGLVRD